MSMQDHILAALREQFHQLDTLLTSLSDEQINAPNFDLDWSIKDVVNHLWGWQQVSIARVNAGVLDRQPAFPDWLTQVPGGWDEDSNQTNAWIYKSFHNQSWTEVHEKWKSGFLQLLDAGAQLTERDLLDGDRYAWLNGYSLASVLVASYEHHQEHLEKLMIWLQEQEAKE